MQRDKKFFAVVRRFFVPYAAKFLQIGANYERKQDYL